MVIGSILESIRQFIGTVVSAEAKAHAEWMRPEPLALGGEAQAGVLYGPDGNSGLWPASFQEGATALSAARQFQVFSSRGVGMSQRTNHRLWASSGNLPFTPMITKPEEL